MVDKDKKPEEGAAAEGSTAPVVGQEAEGISATDAGPPIEPAAPVDTSSTGTVAKKATAKKATAKKATAKKATAKKVTAKKPGGLRAAEFELVLTQAPPNELLFNVIMVGRALASTKPGDRVTLSWPEDEETTRHGRCHTVVGAVRLGPFSEVIQRHAGLNHLSNDPAVIQAHYERENGGPLGHDPGCTVLYLAPNL